MQIICSSLQTDNNSSVLSLRTITLDSHLNRQSSVRTAHLCVYCLHITVHNCGTQYITDNLSAIFQTIIILRRWRLELKTLVNHVFDNNLTKSSKFHQLLSGKKSDWNTWYCGCDISLFRIHRLEK